MSGGQLQALSQNMGQQPYQAPQQTNPYAGAGRFMGGMDLQYQPFRPQTYQPAPMTPIMSLFNQAMAAQTARQQVGGGGMMDAGPGSGAPDAGGSGTTGIGTGTGQGGGGATSSPGIGESGLGGGGQAPGEAPGPGADGGAGGGGGK